MELPPSWLESKADAETMRIILEEALALCVLEKGQDCPYRLALRQTGSPTCVRESLKESCISDRLVATLSTPGQDSNSTTGQACLYILRESLIMSAEELEWRYAL